MEVSIPILVLDDWQMPASPYEVVLAALMVLKRSLKWNLMVSPTTLLLPFIGQPRRFVRKQ